MEYSKLVEVYEKLGSTQSTLEKTDILSEFFQENDEEVEDLVLLCMGRAFPKWQDKDLGISSKTMVDIISEATGRTSKEVEEEWKEKGDLGNAAEVLVEKKTQQRLMTKELTVERVLAKLEKIGSMETSGLSQSVSMDKKKKEVAELVSSASPLESKYVVRTFLENLRLGVAEGLIRDALSQAFFDGENKEDIQRAYDLTNDFREVAKACSEGIDNIKELKMELFRPINSMLAKNVDSIEDGFEEVGTPAAIDWKYDGMRAQIHIKEGEVKLYTRRLDDVTKQFPDAVKAVKQQINAERCIIDAELLAYDPEDGSMIPFQKLSQRIKRKYDIQKLAKEIPVEVRPFDLLYLDQESLIDKAYSNRWKKLKEIVDEEKLELRLVDHIETSDVEEVFAFRQKSLSEGQEGIMMKSLEAVYKPGNRVGYMVKLKPVMETLDLAIIGAKWSEGRRSGWLGRLKLGCYDEDKDEYLEIGMMSTGLTDEQFEEMTEKLKPLIIEEDGRDVKVKPEVIVEAEYEEIQKSPTYSSGYALRFPRMKSFREDKDKADSLEKVKGLYENQS